MNLRNQGLFSDSAAYKISVTGNDGRITDLELWERTVNGKKDPDRLYGRKSGSEEYFIIRYFDIDPLLKKNFIFLPGKIRSLQVRSPKIRSTEVRIFRLQTSTVTCRIHFSCFRADFVLPLPAPRLLTSDSSCYIDIVLN